MWCGVVTGSSLPTAENTLEATVEVPVTTVEQLLTGTPQGLHNPDLKAVLLEADTPALQAVMADAGFSRFVVELFSRQLQTLGAATPSGSGHNQPSPATTSSGSAISPSRSSAAAPRHSCGWGGSAFE